MRAVVLLQRMLCAQVALADIAHKRARALSVTLPHVLLVRPLRVEPQLALLAGEVPAPPVGEHVVLQSAFDEESPSTLVTLVRHLFAVVHPKVNEKRRFRLERRQTHRAVVRLVSRVRTHVQFERARMNETLPAQRAFVFALRKMSLDVRVEVKGRGEELETDSALDDVRRFGQPRGVVQLDVSLEGVEVAEGLRAQVAVEGLGGTVVVDVALQRLHGRKRFPAFVTHERVGTIDSSWKEGRKSFI